MEAGTRYRDWLSCTRSTRIDLTPCTRVATYTSTQGQGRRTSRIVDGGRGLSGRSEHSGKAQIVRSLSVRSTHVLRKQYHHRSVTSATMPPPSRFGSTQHRLLYSHVHVLLCFLCLPSTVISSIVSCASCGLLIMYSSLDCCDWNITRSPAVLENYSSDSRVNVDLYIAHDRSRYVPASIFERSSNRVVSFAHSSLSRLRLLLGSTSLTHTQPFAFHRQHTSNLCGLEARVVLVVNE